MPSRKARRSRRSLGSRRPEEIVGSWKPVKPYWLAKKLRLMGVVRASQDIIRGSQDTLAYFSAKREGLFILSMSLLDRRFTAEGFLNFMAKILPKRIANEEVGDALEAIHKKRIEGISASNILGTVLITTFWLLINSAIYLIQCLYRRYFLVK